MLLQLDFTLISTNQCWSLLISVQIELLSLPSFLGVLNLKLQNEALLLKFLHKFYNKHDTPWVTLLWKSYYQEKVPHAMDPCGSFWWRDVCKLMPIFRGISKCKVGNGSTALFWKD